MRDAIRRRNRAVTDPRQLRSAGQPGAYTAVVHHRGRTGGTDYRTPVVAVPADAGFAIALPYGPGADGSETSWRRARRPSSTRAAPSRWRARSWVRAADANPFLPAKEQRLHRLYGVDDFLLLQEAGPT